MKIALELMIRVVIKIYFLLTTVPRVHTFPHLLHAERGQRQVRKGQKLGSLEPGQSVSPLPCACSQEGLHVLGKNLCSDYDMLNIGLP